MPCYSYFLGQTPEFSWPIRFYAVRHRGFLCQIPLIIANRLCINMWSAFQRGGILILSKRYRPLITSHINYDNLFVWLVFYCPKLPYLFV